MALSIRNPQVEKLARTLAVKTGRDMTQTIQFALEQLELRYDQSVPPLRQKLTQIAAHCASLPLIDHRSPEQILGYNEEGGL